MLNVYISWDASRHWIERFGVRVRARGRYLELVPGGQLRERARRLELLLKRCQLCPRRCNVDRTKDQVGACGIGRNARVASYGPHFGEESVLVGQGGSGTVFLAGCNLSCIFCQNYSISHFCQGEEMGTEDLARIMVRLQEMGCENINWVTPTHQVPQLVKALCLAAEDGLTLPVVYNCGGYEDASVLDLLDGVVDVYLPDTKFVSPQVSMALASAPDYFPVACRALRKMHRQVGLLRTDSRGVAIKGVLVRHLVLPGDLAGSRMWARALSKLLGKRGAVNVMGQYRPAFRAASFQPLHRPVLPDEVHAARREFEAVGLRLVDNPC